MQCRYPVTSVNILTCITIVNASVLSPILAEWSNNQVVQADSRHLFSSRPECEFVRSQTTNLDSLPRGSLYFDYVRAAYRCCGRCRKRNRHRRGCSVRRGHFLNDPCVMSGLAVRNSLKPWGTGSHWLRDDSKTCKL